MGNSYATPSGSTLMVAEPSIVPLQQRIEQLAAGISDLLAKTEALTYYPHQQNAPPELPKDMPREASLLTDVDRLNSHVFELNLRLTRVNEVVGGRI